MEQSNHLQPIFATKVSGNEPCAGTRCAGQEHVRSTATAALGPDLFGYPNVWYTGSNPGQIYPGFGSRRGVIEQARDIFLFPE